MRNRCTMKDRRVYHPIMDRVNCHLEQNCQRAGSSDCTRCTHNKNHKTDYFSPATPCHQWYPTWWYWYPSTPIYCGGANNDISWSTGVTYASSGGSETSSGGMTPREAIEDLYIALDEDLYQPKETTK